LCGCGKDDPEPEPVTTTTTSTDGTVTYYIDGVLQTPNNIYCTYYSAHLSLSAAYLTSYPGIVLDIWGNDTIPYTYYLSDNTSFGLNNHIALLVDSGVYYTEYCMYSGNESAFVTIEAVDYTNKVVSGTFEGQVCFESDTNGILLSDTITHVITNGVFTNVPFQ